MLEAITTVQIGSKTWNVVAQHKDYWLVTLDNGVYPLNVMALPAPPTLSILDEDLEPVTEVPVSLKKKKATKKK